MRLDQITDYTDELLQVARFRDYCPNGLQVEGRREVGRLVTGVSASQDLLRAAIDARADAVLVHHGYFWRNEDARVLGIKRQRLALLLGHDVSLIAYHLPLDAHRELGNNAQLGAVLGIEPKGWFGDQDIAAHGELPAPMTMSEFVHHVQRRLGREPLPIGDGERRVRRIAWCTGGAQGMIEEAIRLGVDLYLSGEISEHTVLTARESGIGYLAAGHHATERFGVQALGRHLAERFGLEHEFIDVANPV